MKINEKYLIKTWTIKTTSHNNHGK